MKRKKENTHYVDNKKFLEAMIEHRDNVKKQKKEIEKNQM